MKKLLFGLLALTSLQQAQAQKSFRKLPAGSTAAEVGMKISARFIATPHTNFGNPGPPGSLTYPEVCTWFGALRFAHAAKDETLAQQLKERFEPIFNEEKKLVPRPDHVDNNVFGTVPLELYVRTKDQRYLDLGMRFADKQWELPNPENPKESHKKWADRGMSWMTRLWIDDMFMITAIQSQAYKATGERKYIDRAANEMVMYMDSIQRPNGLFFHAPAARKAWLALVTYIDEKGDVREVCEGTNKKNDRQYYLDRRRLTGDLHGQAPVLWCATALLEK